MKRIITAIFILVSILVNAQTFWNEVVDDSDYNISHVTDKELFQDSIILFSGFLSDASCHYPNIFAYNTDGQKLWNIEGRHDIIYTDSNYIYSAGYIPVGCIAGLDQIIVSKYDKNGNEIFSIGYPEVPHEYSSLNYEPKNIDIASDGTILVSSTNSIFKSNIYGTKIHEYEPNLDSEINAIYAISPTSYLIHTQNKIYKSDSSLVLIDSIQFSNSINQLLINNDTVFSLVDQYLIRIDTGLIIIDTVITSLSTVKKMNFYENSLWIQLVLYDSIKLLNFQDFANPDTLEFPVLMNDLDFIVIGNSYTFVGNSYTNQIGIYNFQTPDGEIDNVVLPDIEIIDFDIDSIVLEYGYFLDDSLVIGYSFNTELSIKNNGNDTIASFAVFSDLHGGFNCAQNFFYQKFSDLEILPGQTHTVNLNRAYEDGINNNQLCFQCLAPNSELEILIDDNFLCKTFDIGINDRLQTSFNIYPNPFNDYLIIEQADLGTVNIEIIDINGKALISKAVSGLRIKIETNNLPSGLYLVKVYFDDKIRTSLVVKE